jgi:hypothetical protein
MGSRRASNACDNHRAGRVHAKAPAHYVAGATPLRSSQERGLWGPSFVREPLALLDPIGIGAVGVR